MPDFIEYFLRIESNAWGQEILLGLSWDLIWIFLAVGLGFVLIHLIFKWLIEPKFIRK